VDARASEQSVLFSFCEALDGCKDGVDPRSPLLMDPAGRLFGMTFLGGRGHVGEVFALEQQHGLWKQSVIHSFCQGGCDGGGYPNQSHTLVMDGQGNLYGVSDGGTGSPWGAVFVMKPSGKKWVFQNLHAFTDPLLGKNPVGLTYAGAASGQPYDGVSPLYGATVRGGAQDGGVVFSFTPSNGSWNYAVLYQFCAAANCEDGRKPSSAPVMDAKGNIFGTTANGGANDSGVVPIEAQPENMEASRAAQLLRGGELHRWRRARGRDPEQAGRFLRHHRSRGRQWKRHAL
jgi:uncharacterized repeat protein (TIGR03803 family)